MSLASIVRFGLVIAIAVSLSVTSDSVSAFNTQRVIGVFANASRYPNHIALISHRGVIATGCPENSICSIRKAIRTGTVEAIELDVRSSRNGTLWLLHDQNIGRMTQKSYNMYNNTGSNALIRESYDSYLRTLRLKDRAGTMTGYTLMSLESALSETGGVVAVLDLKSAQDATRAANLVRKLKAGNRVILKLSASWFPAQSSVAATIPRVIGANVYYALTLYAGNLDRIVSHVDTSTYGKRTLLYQRRVNEWIDSAKTGNSRYFTYMEIGNKQFKESDPTYVFALKHRGSQFVPVPEYGVSDWRRLDPDKSYGYTRTDSSCCGDLADYLTRTNNFGKEQGDDRPLIFDRAQFSDYDNFLTDSVESAHRQLVAKGLRKMNTYNVAR